MRVLYYDSIKTAHIIRPGNLDTVRLVLCRTRQVILLLAAMTITGCEKKESPVAQVIVSPESVTIEIGANLQLNSTLKDASANLLTNRSINWSSSNITVATVSPSGVVTGISVGGPVIITANSEGQYGTSQISVTPVSIASITLSTANDIIEIGETLQLVVMLKDANGNTLTGRSITWISNNLSVATVSESGIVTGISVGGPIILTATCEVKSTTAQITVIKASVASVAVTPLNSAILVKRSLQYSAIAKDARGIILADRTVTWSSSNTDIATISGSGLITGLKSGGPVTITATSEGKNGTAQLMVNLPEGVTYMFEWLANHITYSIEYNQSLLERNPGLAAQIEAKIEMLQSPTLANEIVNGSFYAADSVTSMDGRHISITAVFPLDKMRSDANQSVTSIKLALPLLEDFMGTAYPFNAFYDWYGFTLGNSSGGNTINMEDKETYEATTGPNRLLYEDILFHELSHKYIGNEMLTHFLAIYLYNMIHTGSSDIQSWIYFEGAYTAFVVSNSDLFAILDIYQLIGHDGMASAFRTIYLLHPPYGSPLSAECKQAFIDQAPTALRAQVAAKIAMVSN